jgi:hypothetical protein
MRRQIQQGLDGGDHLTRPDSDRQQPFVLELERCKTARKIRRRFTASQETDIGRGDPGQRQKRLDLQFPGLGEAQNDSG